MSGACFWGGSKGVPCDPLTGTNLPTQTKSQLNTRLAGRSRVRMHFGASVFYALRVPCNPTTSLPFRLLCAANQLRRPLRSRITAYAKRVQSMSYRYCKQCGLTRPLADFYINTNGTHRERCKVCVNELAKAHYQANKERAKAKVRALRHADPRIRMAHDARARDKRKGLFSEIEASQIHIPAYCPVLLIPLMSQTTIAAENSPSIDHINPRIGAVPGNWRVISRRANQLKRRHTLDTLREFIKAVEDGSKSLRGSATLQDYRAVFTYLRDGIASSKALESC